MSRTRRSALDRKNEILATTKGLLLEAGLAATTTRHVTERLGVGAGLLNHYFSWSELRAAALEEILRADIEHSLPTGDDGQASASLEHLLEHAFASDADPIWRLWIEAVEESIAHPALAQALGRCAEALRTRLTELIDAGVRAKVWSCPDPAGAAIRIMAAHDGLVGFVLIGAPRLSRAEARDHLRQIVANECRGFPLPATALSPSRRL